MEADDDTSGEDDDEAGTAPDPRDIEVFQQIYEHYFGERWRPQG